MFVCLFVCLFLCIDFTRAINDPTLGNEPSLKIKTLHRRGLAYFETSSFECCVSDTASILMLDPNHIMGRALMARALKMIGELKKAEEQITNVITMENDQPNHFIERGDIRFRAGDKHKCIEAIYGTYVILCLNAIMIVYTV